MLLSSFSGTSSFVISMLITKKEDDSQFRIPYFNALSILKLIIYFLFVFPHLLIFYFIIYRHTMEYKWMKMMKYSFRGYLLYTIFMLYSPFRFNFFFVFFFLRKKKNNKIKNTFVNFITLHSTGKKKEKKIHYKNNNKIIKKII